MSKKESESTQGFLTSPWPIIGGKKGRLFKALDINHVVLVNLLFLNLQGARFWTIRDEEYETS